MPLVAVIAGSASLQAATIPAPNGSFESPKTIFVDVRIEGWQKTPKPPSYDESGGFLWDQLSGIFANTAPGSANHIDNIDGSQAAYLFAVPEVGILQDFDSPAGDNRPKFEIGKSYQLALGVIGGGGGMTNGASLEVSFYHRDPSGHPVTIVATNIVHDPATFPTNTRFVEFQLKTPTVKADDPWAGQNLGVQILSTVSPEAAGGYWDIDNVRVTSSREPSFSTALVVNQQFQLTLESEPGTQFDLLANTTLGASTGWVSLGIITNVTGIAIFSDSSVTNLDARFYRVRQIE